MSVQSEITSREFDDSITDGLYISYEDAKEAGDALTELTGLGYSIDEYKDPKNTDPRFSYWHLTVNI
jgi:hypothetical protein